MANPKFPIPTRSKYGNKRVGAYASKKEHNRAAQLRMMEQAGMITELKEQVPFVLIPAQYVGVKPKCVERSCKYVADFVYRNSDGVLVVEDTKGFRTPEYIIKRKLMLQVHGIRITEI